VFIGPNTKFKIRKPQDICQAFADTVLTTVPIYKNQMLNICRVPSQIFLCGGSPHQKTFFGSQSFCHSGLGTN
jgi:hypothetical protein